MTLTDISSIGRSDRQAEARLAVSRTAVRLILERGLAATSGDDIAAESGVSARTVWRYFRSKESSVEPLLRGAIDRFIALLQRWPLALSIEDYLAGALKYHEQTDQENEDDFAAVRIIALLPQEPALRTAWLTACAEAEADYLPIVVRRSGRPAEDFQVRLCAATTLVAMRLFHEEISQAAIVRKQKFGTGKVASALASAIRLASTLPICDPIANVNQVAPRPVRPRKAR